ncbi:hypothetical protein [Kallotenue papyrolyticum]|uniref:hypothetical protein n=1 Tax=Kallotenue papyrolyticum TaxID=1325125 RepID=UPI0004785CA3|nr:hypothetical protein [Kallotenue papyrolyticum]
MLLMAIGVAGVFVLALIALAAALVVLWSGWHAFREELQPGFRMRAPGLRGVLLIGLGVALPLMAIAVFVVYLALVLAQTGVRAW